jgi:peroxiredoxin Q/BCP
MVSISQELVGKSAPDFRLADPISDNEIHLASLRGSDVLLLFFRGTWCPACRKQMNFLVESVAAITAAQIRIVGVICQSRDTVKRHLESHPLPFPLLPDESREVAKAYGTHYWLSWEGVNLSHPALFILNKEGVVTFAHIGKNQADLPLSLILKRFLNFLGEATPPKSVPLEGE